MPGWKRTPALPGQTHNASVCPVPQRHPRQPQHRPPWGHSWDSKRELCPGSVPSPSPAAGRLRIPESTFHPLLHLLLLGIAETGRMGLPRSHGLPGARAADCPLGSGPRTARRLAFALSPCLLSLLLFDVGINHHKKLQVLKTPSVGHCPFPTRCKNSGATSAGNSISDSVRADTHGYSKDAS